MDTINKETGEVTTRSIKGVAKKMALAMAEMDSYAPKDGVNQYHKYAYTSVAQYMAHVRPALVKYGLVIIPSLVELTDYEDFTTDVLMEYTIIDSETGEYLTARLKGRGQDASQGGKRLDKGPYKAYSGAFKYFLSEMFMIASGDDPDEAGDKPQGKPAQKQQETKQPTPGNSWLPSKDEFFEHIETQLKIKPDDARGILKAAQFVAFTPEKATDMFKAVEKEARIRREAAKIAGQATQARAN